MRNLSKFALAGLLGAGLAGTAVAAEQSVHVLNVALPDGTIAHVHYAGNVAPRITLVPAGPEAPYGFAAGFGLPDFDGIFAQMDRQIAAAMQQMDELSRQPSAGIPAGASYASLGDALAGTESYSSVTISQNGHQCSRSTKVVGQGPGKAPKVTSTVRGYCGQAQAAPSHGGAAVTVPDGPVHQS